MPSSCLDSQALLAAAGDAGVTASEQATAQQALLARQAAAASALLAAASAAPSTLLRGASKLSCGSAGAELAAGADVDRGAANRCQACEPSSSGVADTLDGSRSGSLASYRRARCGCRARSCRTAPAAAVRVKYLPPVIVTMVSRVKCQLWCRLCARQHYSLTLGRLSAAGELSEPMAAQIA
jgi:hypothetical protein